ncbi:MAG TPA: alpha/beta hydrolase-fold protein [Opitutaceae bacterium]|nr:alpha/beta hydrolase-fold protein [Opitutaceae bacterium]
MPRLRALRWALWAALAAAGPAAAGETAPPFVVANTEVRVLPRTRPDRLYQLEIGLPGSFRRDPSRRYPVVFVTDGYWDFTTVLAIYGDLRYSNYVPEMLVVGLGYSGERLDYDALRLDDLLPLGAGPHPAEGHAARFLDLIERAAMPLLQREYRADLSHCYLMGDSKGGGFALYAMLTRPDLFRGYVADSPVTADLGGFEQAMADSGRAVTARLYVSTCANEWPEFRRGIVGFCDRLAARAYLKEGLRFRIIPNLRHADGKPESYMQGLRYVCEPIAPERGPMPDDHGAEGRMPVQIAFLPARPGGGSPGEEAALARHEAYLARLERQKTLWQVYTAPRGESRLYSTATSYRGRAEAEALGRADPAVAAGVLTFTVIEGEDAPSRPPGS